MAIGATMKPRLRYDQTKRVSTSDALASPYLPHHKARTVSEAASIRSRACIYKLEPARARTIIKRSLYRMKSPIAIAAATALGIDIAKAKFDVCLLKENGRETTVLFSSERQRCFRLCRSL